MSEPIKPSSGKRCADREFLVIGWRATSKEAAELEQKVKASGMTRSEFLRRPVAAAEVVTPAQVKINYLKLVAQNTHVSAEEAGGV